ncbi:MAG TPA: glycosyltransferase family 2 protein, partial [Lachnospiraceae bacterium]|nr:glycosyltransferase family 2 protein [Lachnospiraceae bacterium]
MKLLTVIVPCYNEEQTVPLFYEEMKKTMEVFKTEFPETAFELLFIDDGSGDGTMECIRALRKKDECVHYVSFSRNFGKEAAIYAGLSKAHGDHVVLMDADLQDPPSLLPQMYTAVTKEGYDSAATRRVTRKGEPRIRSFFARCFYKLINRLSETEIVDGARDYRIMTRQMVEAVLSMGEYNRFTKGIYGWV